MDHLVFTYRTHIHAPIETVWNFFSTADNLAKITTFPKVTILTNPSTTKGNTILMKLNFFFLSAHWASVIEDVEAPHFFIDKGEKIPFPFKEWHHKHRFYSLGSQTVMEDIVTFKAWVPSYISKPILTNMFKEREEAIRKEFNNGNSKCKGAT
ncbi:hypothetical protein JCM9140_770 [Halalkalibacter wakoensis JCM 9140]|uniref:Cell division inhibitor n=1 Tax=Halalkalibacter wakoensis JCM 9140 TaxID=1236970 RepID=W4PZ98_9BACI|nr:SRPBCC family protein [Halalkalibacter wakoensis]GAE24818.1 hypothetical protein JCM9140_770 [Halalkalibacter wakoensis JCM 9140]